MQTSPSIARDLRTSHRTPYNFSSRAGRRRRYHEYNADAQTPSMEGSARQRHYQRRTHTNVLIEDGSVYAMPNTFVVSGFFPFRA